MSINIKIKTIFHTELSIKFIIIIINIVILIAILINLLLLFIHNMKKPYVLFPADIKTYFWLHWFTINYKWFLFFLHACLSTLCSSSTLFDPEPYFELKLQPSTKLRWCFLPENRKPQAGNGFNTRGRQRDTRDEIR